MRSIRAHSGFTPSPQALAPYRARYPNRVVELSWQDGVAADGRLAPGWRKLLLAYRDRFVVGSDTWSNGRWDRCGEILATYRGWLALLPAGLE